MWPTRKHLTWLYQHIFDHAWESPAPKKVCITSLSKPLEKGEIYGKMPHSCSSSNRAECLITITAVKKSGDTREWWVEEPRLYNSSSLPGHLDQLLLPRCHPPVSSPPSPYSPWHHNHKVGIKLGNLWGFYGRIKRIFRPSLANLQNCRVQYWKWRVIKIEKERYYALYI